MGGVSIAVGKVPTTSHPHPPQDQRRESADILRYDDRQAPDPGEHVRGLFPIVGTLPTRFAYTYPPAGPWEGEDSGREKIRGRRRLWEGAADDHPDGVVAEVGDVGV